jgi:hypothetical protein
MSNSFNIVALNSKARLRKVGLLLMNTIMLQIIFQTLLFFFIGGQTKYSKVNNASTTKRDSEQANLLCFNQKSTKVLI